MKKGIELKQHFHTCMPLFIALGDEIRLTIIEALTDEALTGRTKNNDVNKNQPDKNNDRQISLPAQSRPHGLNVREIQPVAPGSFPPFEDLKDSRADRCPPGGNLQLLLSLNRRQHPEIDAARTSAGIRAFHERLNQDAYLSIF
jgi:hypothetical protein